MTGKKWRGLCVGAGYFSQFHFDAWQRMPDVEIAGICDVNQARAQAAAEKWGIPQWFASLGDALNSLSLDFVDIITRPATHRQVIESAAGQVRAILCQKPLADSYSECQAIAAIARRAGVRFMVHDNFRFQPWYREIKRILDSGLIGNKLHQLYFRARPGDGWGQDAYLARQPYFRDMPRLLIHETGVHFIDTFRYLAGEVDEVYALLRRLNPVIAGEDAGLVTFRFRNGAVGIWDANRYNESTAKDPRFTFGTFVVEADGGSVRLDDEGRLFVKPLGLPETEHAYTVSDQGFAGDCVLTTQRHFIDALRDGREFETDGDEYLKTLAVENAIYQSAQTNRPTSLGEPPAVIDLSLTIDNQLRGVSITTAKTIANDGWNATTLSLYSHCGTHMDAPKHFLEGAASIDQQSLAVCCGPARVLDLTPVQPRELLTVRRLARWAESIEPGARLLLRTDWYNRCGTVAYRDELPRISVELARWLVERQVALVGVEPPSVADVNDMEELTVVHQTLFRGKVVIVEGLAHLDQLPEFVEFLALPLKVRDGDGSPVRAVARPLIAPRIS